jgi:hypothetical protein
MYSSTRFAADATFNEIGLPFLVMGATAVAIGVGFVVSAVIAYGLSRRLGLLTSQGNGPSHDTETNPVRLS